nr:hypothetical protein BaRGS_014233 [Batillaria attramentaria]
MLSTKEWSAENVAVLLDAVENLTLANTWLKTEAQVPEGVSTAVEELSRFIMTCTTLVPDKTQWKVVEGAITRVISLLPAYEKDQKEEDSAQKEEVSRSPPVMLMKVIEDGAAAMDIVLSPVPIETTVAMAPGSEEYQFALGYLFAWQLMLSFFHSAHSQWWKDQDRKTAAYVDKFTCKNISPLLCKSEFQTVQDSENIEGITARHLLKVRAHESRQDMPPKTVSHLVKARFATREVTASYQMEEVKIELQITLPENYPLGNISVSSERRVGVNQAQWDRWLLQLNVFLQHQNGSIMEGLQLWKNNIDKRFEGVEDCMICFAVVHGTNFQLPRLQCRTCKKKFHSACLAAKQAMKNLSHQSSEKASSSRTSCLPVVQKQQIPRVLWSKEKATAKLLETIKSESGNTSLHMEVTVDDEDAPESDISGLDLEGQSPKEGAKKNSLAAQAEEMEKGGESGTQPSKTTSC